MSSRNNKKSPARVVKAETPSKAEIMMHPVRLRLMLTLAGREMTTAQLGTCLPDIAQASLYRHMRLLSEVGIVRVVRETPIRGTVEKVYGLQTEAAHLNQQEMAAAGPEEQTRYFSAFVASLLAQFRAAAREAGDANLIEQGVAYSTSPFYLTDAEYRQVAVEIGAVLTPRLANTPDGQRRRRLISIIVLPDTITERDEYNSENQDQSER